MTTEQDTTIIEITSLTPMISAALARFDGNKEAILELTAKSAGLTTNGPEDKQALAAVKAARIDLKTVRIRIDKIRKDVKADALTYTQAVDGAARELKEMITPEETRLQAEEQKVKDEIERRANEEARLARVETERRVALLSGLGVMVALPVIEAMDAEQFEVMLADAKAKDAERAAKKAAEEAAAKVAANKLAKERAEFNARLARHKADVELERKAQAEAQAKIDAENARIAKEAARVQAEKDAARRAEVEAEAAKERERLANIEAEQAKVKAEQDAEAARLKAEADAQEQARIAAAKQVAVDAQVAESKRIEALAPLERIAERLEALAGEFDCSELLDLAAELRKVQA